jgi:hypothetical protein
MSYTGAHHNNCLLVAKAVWLCAVESLLYDFADEQSDGLLEFLQKFLTLV